MYSKRVRVSGTLLTFCALCKTLETFYLKKKKTIPILLVNYTALYVWNVGGCAFFLLIFLYLLQVTLLFNIILALSTCNLVTVFLFIRGDFYSFTKIGCLAPWRIFFSSFRKLLRYLLWNQHKSNHEDREVYKYGLVFIKM